ncbi:hypothetical protein CRG98_034991 [Punica granatum]|uniref:Uncharacterized protein n=1 Tax=Punica granatum TaxID=22663 RepID=A0A2I0IMN3_PUNGR|nr:hypothetical protein CRG98_034991 [Punica granatum]
MARALGRPKEAAAEHFSLTLWQRGSLWWDDERWPAVASPIPGASISDQTDRGPGTSIIWSAIESQPWRRDCGQPRVVGLYKRSWVVEFVAFGFRFQSVRVGITILGYGFPSFGRSRVKKIRPDPTFCLPDSARPEVALTRIVLVSRSSEARSS